MESIENNDSPEKYLESAIGSNDAFVAELGTFDTLEELREALPDLAYVTSIDKNRSYVLPEITSAPNSEDVQVKIYLVEDIVRSLGVFINDPVTDMDDLEKEVQNWIGHRDIADAVIRIIKKNHNG